MNAASKIDVNSLQGEARISEDKEAFKVLAKTGNCRVGVGARLKTLAEPTFIIEVLVNLCTSHDAAGSDRIERELALFKRLEQNAYALSREEDGCILCELAVLSEDLNAGFKKVVLMTQRVMETSNRRYDD